MLLTLAVAATFSSVYGWLEVPFAIFGLSAARWAWLGFCVLLLAERLLGKSTRPEFRSLFGILTTALQVLLTRVLPLRLIPVVGPAIVRFFEVVAGVDLDGDGKVGDGGQGPSRSLDG